MTDASATVARRAARVLLIDGSGRVLLLRGCDPADPASRYWFTIGGGLEPGESPADAALRETAEETGLRLDPTALRGPVHSDVTRFPFDGRWYVQSQDFFVADVDAFEVDRSGFDEVEVRSVDAWRWWSPEELDATDERVYPPDLAALVREVR